MTIQEYVDRLMSLLSVPEATITIDEVEDEVRVHLDLPEQEAGRVIGHRGEALASVQRIVRIVFGPELEDKKLIFDINDYRQQREDQLIEMAINAAHHVQETGEEYVFPFLPSYERYIIHSAISTNADFSDLETVSHGEGRGRRLIMRRTSLVDEE